MVKGRQRPLEPAFEFAGLSFPRYIPELPLRDLAKRKAKPTWYSVSPPPNTPNAFFYHESDFMPGLRWKWCDKVDNTRIDHTGWFTDDFQYQKIRGLVFRLPKSRGFLAGWTYHEGRDDKPSGMAGEVDTTHIYAEEWQAAYAADKLADRIAEDEREYNAKEQAEREAEEKAAEELKAMQAAVVDDLERVGWCNDDAA